MGLLYRGLCPVPAFLVWEPPYPSGCWPPSRRKQANVCHPVPSKLGHKLGALAGVGEPLQRRQRKTGREEAPEILFSSCGNERSVYDLSEVEGRWLEAGVMSGPWMGSISGWSQSRVSGSRRQVIFGPSEQFSYPQQNHRKLSPASRLASTQQGSQV